MPSKTVHTKTSGTGTRIQICWEQTGLLTRARQNVLATIGILWCFTSSPNWSQGAHTICRCSLECNEPFFFFFSTYQSKRKKAGKRLWVVTCIYSNIASQSLMTTYIETCPKRKPALWWRFKKVWITRVFSFLSPSFFSPQFLGSPDQKQECQNTRGTAHPARFPRSNECCYSSLPPVYFHWGLYSLKFVTVCWGCMHAPPQLSRQHVSLPVYW